MTAFLCIPFIMPLAHRLPRKRLRSAIISVSALSVFAIAVFSSGYIPAFDELHPRRLFILHTENVRLPCDALLQRPHSCKLIPGSLDYGWRIIFTYGGKRFGPGSPLFGSGHRAQATPHNGRFLVAGDPYG